MCAVVSHRFWKNMPQNCQKRKLAKLHSAHCVHAVGATVDAKMAATVDAKTGDLHSEHVAVETEIWKLHLLQVALVMELIGGLEPIVRTLKI